jgi:hypothetical protein
MPLCGTNFRDRSSPERAAGSIPPLPLTASLSLPDALRHRYDFVIAFRNAFDELLSRRQRCAATAKAFEINAGTRRRGNWARRRALAELRVETGANQHMARRLR